MTVVTYPDLLRKAWCRETSSVPEEWSQENPARGQCVPTALVLQDLLGGILLRGVVGEESHYWNMLPEGAEIDMTIVQYGEPAPTPLNIEMRSREYVLSYPETATRYKWIRDRIAVLCAL